MVLILLLLLSYGYDNADITNITNNKMPGARQVVGTVATGWCELMAAEVTCYSLKSNQQHSNTYKYDQKLSTEIYGSKHEKPVFHEHPQEACDVLTEISESLREPPGVFGRM